jgi:6-phosphogluconolactonase
MAAKGAGPVAETLRTIHFQVDPVAEAARRLVAAIASQAGRVRLAVAGGSVAPVLGTVRRNLGPALWRRVSLTWVDERCVPFSHQESNRGGAYRGGHLDAGDPPRFELPLYLDGEVPETSCARVERLFQQEFQGRLDVLLLGLGEDGHIASLFPGRAPGGSIVLAVRDSPKPPSQRITFALAVLAEAPAALMLALGDAKLEALQRLQRGDPALPGSALRHLEVITDLRIFAAETQA